MWKEVGKQNEQESRNIMASLKEGEVFALFVHFYPCPDTSVPDPEPLERGEKDDKLSFPSSAA